MGATVQKHVLIVDDEPAIIFLLSRKLERIEQKLKISTARCGEEALRVANEVNVDVLVTDLRMPGMSGLDLIREMRARNPRVRAILITACGDGAVMEEADHLQVYRCIQKPFDLHEFIHMIEGALYSEGEPPTPAGFAFCPT